MASNNATTLIHVLLVDHEHEGLMRTVNLLELCRYKVSVLEHASVAISILSTGNVGFDVLIANINSPDLHGMKLLEHAVSVKLPTVIMSGDENMHLTLRFLQAGAFLHVKKPLTADMAKYLWQHVMREKLRPTTMVDRDRFEAAIGMLRSGVRQGNPSTNIGLLMNIIGSKKKSRDQEALEDWINRSSVKRKACTEWTQELHDNFVSVVEELGEGRCFPKDILDRMNVPGLTRMQVASHLQKCRNNDWRLPEDRKVGSQRSADKPGGQRQPRPRLFGTMPAFARQGNVEGANGSGSNAATDDVSSNANVDHAHVEVDNNNVQQAAATGDADVQAEEGNNVANNNDQNSGVCMETVSVSSETSN